VTAGPGEKFSFALDQNDPSPAIQAFDT